MYSISAQKRAYGIQISEEYKERENEKFCIIVILFVFCLKNFFSNYKNSKVKCFADVHCVMFQ